MTKTIYILVLILAFFNTNAQNSFSVKLGTSFQPMFYDAINPLQDYSLTPSIDVLIGDDITTLKISLGHINRIGVYIPSKFGFVFGANYAYHINKEEALSHSIETELGCQFKVGKNKDYLFTLTSKAGIMIGESKFYFCPVSIGLLKTIL